MTQTTNFDWTTPDDTDLVKDGALAIRTFGQEVDTSMADLLGGTSGQVLSKNSNTDMDFAWVTPSAGNFMKISKTDMSAVSNQSVNDCFSSTYSSYLIVIEVTLTTGSYLNSKLRVSGTDTSSNYRFYINRQFSTNSTQTYASNSGTDFELANGGVNPSNASILFEVVNPYAAAPTGLFARSTSKRGSTDVLMSQGNGVQIDSTSFTGFSIIPDSGTLTGTITVYGRTA